ncbi:UPF0149 family protein [Nguyenibacter vanlangensis]|uniref:UPF0149 family protein n=1 Tax=Nguyenibacter vanlangensis TaxID=1216886 RepID=UPI0038D0276A
MPPQTRLPPYLRQLERVLARLETAMLLSELDGFLAGVIVCPEMILPSEWLPVALDPDEEGDPGKRELIPTLAFHHSMGWIGSVHAAAFLVFFAGATGAGLVSADLCRQGWCVREVVHGI